MISSFSYKSITKIYNTTNYTIIIQQNNKNANYVYQLNQDINILTLI